MIATGDGSYAKGYASRGIFGEVGTVGENICAPIFDAAKVEQHEQKFADLFNFDHGVSFQVKTANYSHGGKITAGQLEQLYLSVRDGFVVQHGVYAIVFWHGISNHPSAKTDRGRPCRKSKIKSKAISCSERAKIIFQDLQFIFLVDARLLRYILRRHPSAFYPRKKEARQGVMFSDKRHLASRRSAVEPGRQFFLGFIQGNALQKRLLRGAFSRGYDEDTRGMIETHKVSIICQNNGSGDVLKKIPVHVVGRGDTVKAVRKMTRKRVRLDINGNGNEQLVSLPG